MKEEYKIKPLHLQFFADEGGEKTEQPSQRKKDDSRKKGQVAKSTEVNNAFIFIFGFTALKIFISYMYKRVVSIFHLSAQLLDQSYENIFGDYFVSLVADVFLQVILIVAPIFCVLMFSGVLFNLIQVGWKPTLEPLKPKGNRFNPISGFKRMFSLNALMELFKTLCKLILIGYIIYTSIRDEMDYIPLLIQLDVFTSLVYIGNLIINMGVKVGMFFLFIAAADYGYQRYKHMKDLKMTKQEVKDEYKNTEGDPQVKGKIKQIMRQASQKRMMQDVPMADVIVTNPTHYAVALRYDRSSSDAPIVVAKGSDFLARKIKEIAKENRIQIVENKQLARTLYDTVEVGAQIPPELYQAVAELLAYVYNLKNA